jgi:Uma2 family endonuclease
MPGQATESDLVAVNERKDGVYELVDGTLVEKVMGFPESSLAMWLGFLIQNFLQEHDLGVIAGEAGLTQLMPGLVRAPDISFTRWERLPRRGEVPDDPVARIPPDLVVEVISKGNTRAEIKRKLKEYFLAGVGLVWLIDPRKRTVKAHLAPDRSVVRTEGQTLDGGDVLPGFRLPLRELFRRTAPTGHSKRDSGREPRKRNGIG